MSVSELSREERARLRTLEQAHIAGRMGLARLPDETLFAGGIDPTDSGVIRMLDAFIAGQQERQK